MKKLIRSRGFLFSVLAVACVGFIMPKTNRSVIYHETVSSPPLQPWACALPVPVRMLGAEIDFIVKGIDSKTRSVVASRKEAMPKKRQIFYLDTDAQGMYRVYEGRIVQARVIAVAEKVIWNKYAGKVTDVHKGGAISGYPTASMRWHMPAMITERPGKRMM